MTSERCSDGIAVNPSLHTDDRRLNVHGISYFVVAVDFVEVHIAVDFIALFVDDADIGLIFFNGRDFGSLEQIAANSAEPR